MNFDECIRFANEHAICSLGTIDGDQPRVRTFGMWFADKEGFHFSTAKGKEVYRQLRENAKAELCFYAPPARPLGEGGTIDLGKAMRASGNVVFLDDPKLKERLLGERRFYVLMLKIWFCSALKKAKRGFGLLPTVDASLPLNELDFKATAVERSPSVKGNRKKALRDCYPLRLALLKNCPTYQRGQVDQAAEPRQSNLRAGPPLRPTGPPAGCCG